MILTFQSYRNLLPATLGVETESDPLPPISLALSASILLVFSIGTLFYYDFFRFAIAPHFNDV